MIELKNLYKSYRGKSVLMNISLTIQDNEFFVLIGSSGCGKTTLLKTLNKLNPIDKGEILINGTPINRIKVTQLPRLMGYVVQEGGLFPHMTVEDNIALAMRVAGYPKEKIYDRITELLELVNLEPDQYRSQYPSQLSGGQQQRVAIARSLVNEPEILLLDEPLGALDLKLRKEMQLELKRLQREMNITFIYVTHDQEEALTMSDTVVVMNGGKVQQIGTPEDIYNEPKNAFVAAFIGDSNIVDGVMHRDFLVSFSGVDFPCVDRGFAREQSVQVVVRPEDIEVVSPVEGQLVGVVNDVIFKGVHFEMHVECEGREWLIHSTRACTPGETIGMRIGPNEIHIMARSEG